MGLRLPALFFLPNGPAPPSSTRAPVFSPRCTMQTLSPRRDRPEPVAKVPAPAVMISAECPNCGRKCVVVFSALWWGSAPPAEKRPLVCFACCPKIPVAS